MIFKQNILEIIDNYDSLILDVWGVIHDGDSAYPMVKEHLQQLREMGKKIYFLSNAPRRAQKVSKVLAGYGVTPDLYDAILTSGEAAFLFLQDNQEGNFKDFGQNYYYIGPEKDLDLLDGLNYKMIKNAKDADFVVNTGFDNYDSTLEEKLPQLQEAIKHNLPMICVNPDLLVVKRDGREMLCAGISAAKYKEMGGEVLYFGKPYHLVYDTIFKLFSIKDKTKILAVGDGMETDILGAANNNIDSALIPGGILSNKLKVKYGELPKKEDLELVCKSYQTYPQFVIAGL